MRSKMILAVVGLVAAWGWLQGGVASAAALDEEYPYAAAPCVYAPYRQTGQTPGWCPDYTWGLRSGDDGTASTISPYGYAYRNCTDYAAWRLQAAGVPDSLYKGLGNAKEWARRASLRGLTVDGQPAVGAVGVRTTGKYGHVAVVEAVAVPDKPAGTIRVAQYNAQGSGVFSTQTGTPQALGLREFIHFEVLALPVLELAPTPVPVAPALEAAPEPVPEAPAPPQPMEVANPSELPPAEPELPGGPGEPGEEARALPEPKSAPAAQPPVAVIPPPTPASAAAQSPPAAELTTGLLHFLLTKTNTPRILPTLYTGSSSMNNDQQPNPTNFGPAPSYDEYQHLRYQAEQRQALASVVSSAQEVLYEASSVFPFALFPDTITIDREKLTITRRSFFKTGEVQSLRIDDILNITAHVGPFFGAIKVTLRFVDKQQPEEVHYLKRRDALSIQRIAQGYNIARQQGVDCATLPKQQLVAMLLSLGRGVGNSARP